MISNSTRRILANTMDIDALSKSTGNAVVKQLLIARKRILNKLQELPDDAVFTRAHYLRVLEQTNGTLLGLGNRYKSIIKSTQLEVIKSEYKSVQTALFKDAKETPDVEVSIPVKRLAELQDKKIAGKTIDNWIKNATSNLQKGLVTEFSQAMILGENVKQVSDRIRKKFELSRKQANILTRTTLLQTAKNSRDAVYGDNEEFIVSYTYLATLDTRTCIICGSDDGKTEKDRSKLPQPLRHPQCRCVITPNTKFSEPTQRPAVVESEAHTTHHRDGSTSTKFTPTKVQVVDSKVSYTEFFEGQPDDWKKDVLGSRKFELYKQGNLDLEDLKTKRTNRILTVKELRKRVDG